MEAQYNVLRKNGHSPSEAFNETVEELTQSLIRLVAQNGMDWMYANCSTTAQRGALDWAPKFREAVAPVFEDLYRSVISGEETRRVLSANSAPDYREKLNKELAELSVETAELEAAVGHIAGQLGEIREKGLLELADRYELECEIPLELAKDTLRDLTVSRQSLRNQLRGIRRPEVLVIGGE